MTLFGSFLVAMGVKAEATPIARKETIPAQKISQGDTTVPVQTTIKQGAQVVNPKTFKENTMTLKELPTKDLKYFKGGENKDSLTSILKNKASGPPIKGGLPANETLPIKNDIPIKAGLPIKGDTPIKAGSPIKTGTTTGNTPVKSNSNVPYKGN